MKQRGEFVTKQDTLSYEIGNRIYERRKQIGMTQERLSEITGSTPQAISNYERGERELRAGMIIKMAEALGVTADYLLTGKSNSSALSSKIDVLPQKNQILINDIIDKCIELIKSNS